MIELKLEQNQNKQKQDTQEEPWEVELVHVARVRINIHILLFLSLCRETLPWLLKFSLLVKKIGSYLMWLNFIRSSYTDRTLAFGK